MRALRIHQYGGPEAMRIEEAPVPQPGPGEVLVRVEAATVNPIDWKIREGMLRSVLPLAFPRTLGRDCAGTVVLVGPPLPGEPAAADLAPGARVIGVPSPAGGGTQAEYAVIPAAQCAPVPPGLASAEAACCGVAGLSAYQPLVDVAGVGRGQRVLIHAAAGGVGGFAVQLARAAGAEVIATASAANADYVRGLGADRVIDYRAGDFAQQVAGCDIAFDSVGGETHVRSLAVLKPGGIIVSLSAAPIPAHAPRADVRAVAVRIGYARAQLAALLERVASGQVRPQIGARLGFDEAARAYALSEQGGVRGKIVLVF